MNEVEYHVDGGTEVRLCKRLAPEAVPRSEAA
jgi:hypothetical protein